MSVHCALATQLPLPSVAFFTPFFTLCFSVSLLPRCTLCCSNRSPPSALTSLLPASLLLKILSPHFCYFHLLFHQTERDNLSSSLKFMYFLVVYLLVVVSLNTFDGSIFSCYFFCYLYLSAPYYCLPSMVRPCTRNRGRTVTFLFLSFFRFV